MTEFQLHWPEGISADDVATDIEACCNAIGLTQTLRSTLAKYPGCVHWHYKQGHAIGVGTPKGVLEITLWPQQYRLWLAIHRNRTAGWVDEAAARLKTETEACFQKRLAVLKR